MRTLLAAIVMTGTVSAAASSPLPLPPRTAAVAPPSTDALPIQIERYQLDNGIRVIIAHVPDAPRQSIFTLLPLHLGNDGPDRAQWSHLLEHHLIRSTDPQGLFVEGVDINGETTHHAARLDTIALPEQWLDALQRHAAWLTAREFDADVHANEVRMIHGEEQAVAMGGWTHKFALAAWNQIVRHGRPHAKVHGDVAESQVEQVMQYARAHLPIDESVWIATVGPVDLTTVKAEVARHIGVIDPMERPTPRMVREGEAPATLSGTWDLPTRHVMLWWKLPAHDASSIAAAMALGDAAQMRLSQDQAVTEHTRLSAVHTIVPTPEGAYFIINANLRREADADEALQAIRRGFISVASLPGPLFMARQLPSRLLDPQLLAAQRPHVPAEMAFAVEGNWMVQGVLLEYVLPCSVEELKEASAMLSQEDIAAFLTALLESPGGTLVLEPQVPEDLQR